MHAPLMIRKFFDYYSLMFANYNSWCLFLCHFSLKIGKFDLDSIPGYVKGLVFFAIFGLFFGGLFYLLKSVEKKPKDKKDKKKKKTQ